MIKQKGKETIFEKEEIQDIINLYVNENWSIKKIGEKYNNSSYNCLKRLLELNGIKLKKVLTQSKFNKYYFDVIDSEDKAYWLGFIWSDGYMCIRDRNNNGNISYEFKLSLAKEDKNHLEKFKKCIDSDFIIKEYKSNNPSFENAQNEVRLMLYNKYFCENLVKNYGLVPHRNKINKLIQNIPNNLIKHFIRGVFDADGSVNYYIDYTRYNTPKITISFNCCDELIDFINLYFINSKLMNTKLKTYKRHEERDVNCISIHIAGKNQCENILNHLYKDSTIYLERKYIKYINKWN